MKSIKDRLKEKIALLRLRQGDTEAFGFIYESYAERIYRYIYFRVSDQGIAHDLVQEVFLQTWEYIVSKKPVDNLQSFIYRIAYHKIVDHYRVKERQATLIDDMPEQITSTSDVTDLEIHFLKKHIFRLKSEYQDVVLLRYVEGLSIGEISDILGKDANNVRVTLHRAMESLKSITAVQPKQKQHKQ